MKRYEIWRAKVRFEESEDVKERPVLIWNDMAYSIAAYKMTTVNRTFDHGSGIQNPEEFEILHWQEAGLDAPTFIRLRKVLRLEPEDMVRKIGELDPRDRLRLNIVIAGIG